MRTSVPLAVIILVFSIAALDCFAQMDKEDVVDQKVLSFLKKMQFKWRGMNVSQADGELLYDIVLKNKYKKALELGTSTGHSGIWIAWALSKTGGKLITVEINEQRYREAVANFKEAGLSEYIDARLADAHSLVNELSGPFDFVFIDADKEWYTNYAKALIPKLEGGGCIAAHNVTKPRLIRWGRGRRGSTSDYYEYMMSQPDFETAILAESWAGLAVSYKKKQRH